MHQHQVFLGNPPQEQSHGQKQEPRHLPFLLLQECHNLPLSVTRSQLSIRCFQIFHRSTQFSSQISFFFAIITLIRAFGVGNAWVPSWTFAGQRTICRSQFLPSITWVPRTEFRFGGKRLYLLSYLSRPCQKYFHVSHRLRQEYLGFEVSLSSRVRSHLKRK